MTAGIVLIVSGERGRPVSEPEIEAFARDFESLRGPGRRHAAAAASSRLIKIDGELAQRPGIETSESSWAAATGLLYHDGPLVGAQPEQLDGQFGYVSYDAGRGELVVASDPFGMHGLFVAEREGRTYVCTSALALAKHVGAQPSRLGLRIFLHAGAHFGTMTNWEGVERLDPGTCLRFNGGSVRRETYWRPAVDPDVSRLGFKAAVEHGVEASTEAFRAQLAGRSGAWSDLTGGFDSRLLTLLLRNAGMRFRTNTVGDSGEDDVRIAREVAGKAGWEWSQLVLPADWPQQLPGWLRPALAWGDGMLDAVQLGGVTWGHAEKGRHGRFLVGGGGGEHFRGHAWRQQFPNAGRSSRVNMDNWIDMRLLHPPIAREVLAEPSVDDIRDDFRRRMMARVAPYSGARNTTQLDVLQAYKTTGHFGAYQAAAGAFVLSALPFYTKPVFTAAFSTDYRHRNHHRLMRHMIWRLDPGVAALETDTGGPAEPWRVTNLPRFWPYYRKLGRQAAGKLSRKALGRSLPARRPEGEPSVVAARLALLEHLAREGVLRHEHMRARSLYDPRALEGLLRRAGEPGFTGSALLGRIVTIELALREAGAELEG